MPLVFPAGDFLMLPSRGWGRIAGEVGAGGFFGELALLLGKPKGSGSSVARRHMRRCAHPQTLVSTASRRATSTPPLTPPGYTHTIRNE